MSAAAVGEPGAERRPARPATRAAAWAAVGATTALVIGASMYGRFGLTLLVVLAMILIVVAWHRTLLAWPTLLAALLLVILFIPIRRYSLVGGLGFQLDPYRVMTACLVLVWGLALLVDPRTRRRPTGVELPMAILIVVLLLSWLTNAQSILAQGLVTDIVKTTTFFASFFIVMILTASLISTRRQLDNVVKLLVIGGAVIGASAIVESRTGTNVFNTLQRFIPVLQLDPAGIPQQPVRGAGTRAYASAEHPIALGAALVLLMPLAVYLYRRAVASASKGYVWLVAATALCTGALASQSRTAVVMLVVQLLVFLRVRRAETMRLVPLLLPMLIAVHFVIPGTLGTIKSAFFPEGGSIISEQQSDVSGDGSGRLLKAERALTLWADEPLFGSGFGSRRVSVFAGSNRNANILDNQWLGSLLEIGALGVGGLLWLFLRAGVLASRWAKSDTSYTGWLFAGLTAGIVAFPAGMLTFDAFAFNQVTLLMFVLIGLAAAARRVIPAVAPEAARSQAAFARLRQRRGPRPGHDGAFAAR